MDARMPDDPSITPGGPPETPATPSMEGGGVYFRWSGKLWQEQADGSFLVWNEESHTWETSSSQPPPQQGETRRTKECPNCGKRVKATLRHCPFCEHGFEDRVTRAPTPAPAATRAAKRSLPAGAALVALAVAVAVVVGGLLLFQRARSCEAWRSAVDEITQAQVEVQGLPQGTTEAELHELNEERLRDKRPGGCE